MKDPKNISLGRDFGADIPVKDWEETEIHLLLGPARSYIGERFLRTKDDWRSDKRGKLLRLVLVAIRKEINFRRLTEQSEIQIMSPSEINRRLIDAIGKEVNAP